jgi:hypothetical protein
MAGHLTGRLPEDARVRAAPTGPGRANPPGITAGGGAVVVHNLDPAESAIERLSAEEFRRAYHVPDAAGGAGQAAAVTPLPGGQRPGELWAYVVWVLLIVLGIELVIANRTRA